MTYIPERGDGLTTTGVYNPNTGANYIGSATSLKDADDKLDTALRTNILNRGATTGTFVEALNSGSQSLSANTITKVTFTTENIDTNSEFTNSTFTSAIAQKVLVIADIGTTGIGWGNNTILNIYIYVNGSSKYSKRVNLANNVGNVQICAVLSLSALNTVEIYAMKTDAGGDSIRGSTLMIAQQF